jgi:hypothetical protein
MDDMRFRVSACLHSESPRLSRRENSTYAAPYFRGGLPTQLLPARDQPILLGCLKDGKAFEESDHDAAWSFVGTTEAVVKSPRAVFAQARISARRMARAWHGNEVSSERKRTSSYFDVSVSTCRKKRNILRNSSAVTGTKTPTERYPSDGAATPRCNEGDGQ